MNIQYQNELESSLYYANKENQLLKNKLQYLKQYIEQIDDRNSLKLQLIKKDMKNIINEGDKNE